MADQQPDTARDGDRRDERGVIITRAGQERMRRQLVELGQRWTREQREERRRAFLDRLNAA